MPILHVSKKTDPGPLPQFQAVASYKYSPWTTALSQTCLCGRKDKKALSQRTHHCPTCGLVVQRDLLSAYLGMFVRPKVDATTGEIVGDTLDLDLARKAWSTGPDALVPMSAAWRSRVEIHLSIKSGGSSARRRGHWSGSRPAAGGTSSPTEMLAMNHHIRRLRPRSWYDSGRQQR